METGLRTRRFEIAGMLNKPVMFNFLHNLLFNGVRLLRRTKQANKHDLAQNLAKKRSVK